jgi:hypothetical protein
VNGYQRSAVEDIIRSNGNNLLSFALNSKQSMEVMHASPTYSLMKLIAESLDEGYIYAATSKLKSYKESIHDKNFSEFNDKIKKKAEEKTCIVSRLYYVKGNKLDSGTENDIGEAALAGIKCRYQFLDDEEFPSKKDIAVIARCTRSDQDKIERASQTFEENRQPISALTGKDAGWEVLCVMEFHLGNTNNTVDKITFFKPDHERGKSLIWEFEKDWPKSRVFEETNGNEIEDRH